MRLDTLTRVIAILRMLEGGRRWTLYQFASRFNVHPRTIRRDLEALKAAGVPIVRGGEVGQGFRGKWWLCR